MLEHHRLMPRWARLIYIANDPGLTFMRRPITSSTDSVRSSVEIISRLNGRRYRETWRRRGLQHFAQPTTQFVESAGAHASAWSGDTHRRRSTRRPQQRDAHTADGHGHRGCRRFGDRTPWPSSTNASGIRLIAVVTTRALRSGNVENTSG